MKHHLAIPLLLLAACSPATHGDTVDVSCDEVSREPYLEAESSIEASLDDYVAKYTALDGAWIAEVACVGGDTGEVEVSITVASTSDMEVATYEGTCGVSVGVVAETPVTLDSEAVSVPSTPLETSVSDGGAWGVAIMSGEASNGTAVLIEMAADGELRGSTISYEVTGPDQETRECEFTNWRR